MNVAGVPACFLINRVLPGVTYFLQICTYSSSSSDSSVSLLLVKLLRMSNQDGSVFDLVAISCSSWSTGAKKSFQGAECLDEDFGRYDAVFGAGKGAVQVVKIDDGQRSLCCKPFAVDVDAAEPKQMFKPTKAYVKRPGQGGFCGGD